MSFDVGVFGRAARDYDETEPRFFAHFGRRLVELSGISGGHVLDVACGKGAVLAPAATVADRAVGVDLAPEMVAEATAAGLDARVMDAQVLEFGDAEFDAVFCAFAIFFFRDARRALAEFRRVLRPRGLVGLTVFGDGDRRWDPVRELMRRGRPAPADDRPDVERELASSGFVDVRVSQETLDGTYADGAQWIRWAQSHGMRAFFERLSREELEHFEAEAFPLMEAAREDDGLLHNRITAVFAFGRKP